MFREHPVRILKYSYKNIWLLIVPVFRIIRTFGLDTDRLCTWLKGAWIDIAAIGGILFFGLLQWHFSVIEICGKSITFRNGLFIRTVTSVCTDNLCSASFEEPFFLRPFGTIRVSLSTNSGSFGKPDLKFVVSRKNAEIIRNAADPRIGIRTPHKSGVASILMLSAFFSSSYSGAIFTAFFMFKGGSAARGIAEDSIEKIKAGSAELSDRLAAGIPSLFITVGLISLGMWAVSFLANLLKYAGFSVHQDGDFHVVQHGLFSKRQAVFFRKGIYFSDLRQSLIMKLFGLYTEEIGCPGFGNSHRHMPVAQPMCRIIPSVPENEIIFIKPDSRSLFQYTWQPVLIQLILVIFYLAGKKFYPNYSQPAEMLLLTVGIPSVWLIICRITALKTGFVRLYQDKITVSCIKGFGFHTLTSDRKGLVKLTVRQNVFQRNSGKCSLRIHLFGAKSAKYTIKGLSYVETKKIIDIPR
ncbi:MAG: hypothetical protein ACI4JE_08440 [Ruminococcus sp.]